jgi:hypothetical protein
MGLICLYAGTTGDTNLWSDYIQREVSIEIARRLTATGTNLWLGFDVKRAI